MWRIPLVLVGKITLSCDLPRTLLTLTSPRNATPSEAEVGMAAYFAEELGDPQNLSTDRQDRDRARTELPDLNCLPAKEPFPGIYAAETTVWAALPNSFWHRSPENLSLILRSLPAL